MTEQNESTPEDGVVTVEEFMDLKKQLGAAKVELKDTVTAKDAEIATYKEQVEAFQKKEKDMQWEQFSQKIPKGLVHDEATKQAARAEWEENPQMFMMKVIDAMSKAPEGTGEEGVAFQQKNKADDDKTADADLAAMGINLI